MLLIQLIEKFSANSLQSEMYCFRKCTINLNFAFQYPP